MTSLRSWDRTERHELLWCNGLVPGLATAGRPNRVLHLHQHPQSRAQWLASHVAAAGVKKVIVPSHSMKVGLLEKHAIANRHPDVLPNWTQPFTLSERVKGSTDVFRIGFLGRTLEKKGIITLAHALEELERRQPRKFRLVLAGEPRHGDAGEATRVQGALGRVEHLIERKGWMSQGEFFGSVDLAVFPSSWSEPFGLVVAEAQYARCPFVISDAGALPEVAGPGHPWVSPAGDAGALADVIEEASRADNRALVESAYSRWTENYSPAAGKKRLAAILATVAPGSSASSADNNKET